MTFWMNALAVAAVAIAAVALVCFVLRVLWKLFSGDAERLETERRVAEKAAESE